MHSFYNITHQEANTQYPFSHNHLSYDPFKLQPFLTPTVFETYSCWTSIEFPIPYQLNTISNFLPNLTIPIKHIVMNSQLTTAFPFVPVPR